MKLGGLWKHRRAVRDFAEEIEAHVRLEADELEAGGLSRIETNRRARATFGSSTVARERFYLRGRSEVLQNLVRDIRYGPRMMARNPAVSAVAVLTVACGIGACATVFTWINPLLLQPLSGVANPGRLVTLETVTSNGEWVPNSYPDYMTSAIISSSLKASLFRTRRHSASDRKMSVSFTIPE